MEYTTIALEKAKQEEVAQSRLRICALYFEAAESVYDKSNPSYYTIEQRAGDDICETILLKEPKNTQTMLLRRSVGAESLGTAFPYTLSEQMMGVDTTTREPCDVWHNYMLSTQGDFYLEVPVGEQTIVALCGPDQHQRLSRFLAKSDVVPFAQSSNQSP